MLTAVRNNALLAPAVRELVVLRIAALLSGTLYEIRVPPHARRAVVPDSAIQDLAARKLPANLTRLQDLALKLADVMARQITVSDALMQQLQKHFSPQTLLELVATVGGLQHGVHAYGWDRSEYERTGIAQRDKTWTGAGIDIDPLIAQVCAFDHHVGAALRLIRAFGLRRKEAVMMRPHACVVPFSATGLPLARKKAETYLWVCQGSKGGRPRHVPITTAEQQEALAFAQAVAGGGGAHVSDPDRLLHQNLNHFTYVLRRFGLSLKDRGATAHGLQHELFVQVWREQTSTEPPVRGGGRAAKEREEAAWQEIVELAGHGRKRAAGAYIGSARRRVVPSAVSVGPLLHSFGRADTAANGPAHDVE